MDWLWLVGIFAALWVFASAFVSTARGERPADTIRFESASIGFGIAFPLFALALLLSWLAAGGDLVASVRNGDWMTQAGWVIFPLIFLYAFVSAVVRWSWRVQLNETGVSFWQFGRERVAAPWSAVKSAEARNEALVIHLHDGRCIPLIYQNNWISLVRSWCIDTDKPFYDGGQRKVTKTLDG